MFLFITGRNRKIYFTKNNTAFYKSKKNNVDVTYMFKKTKNGLKLKKKYLKTGGGIEETQETEETEKTEEFWRGLRRLKDTPRGLQMPPWRPPRAHWRPPRACWRPGL